MPYVYSTMSCDQAYSLFEKGGGDLPIQKRICIIRGGTGVADSRLTTPKGVATRVTEKELELLEQCDAFKRHKQRGYLRVDKQEMDAEKAVAGLQATDGSAPLTEASYKNSKRKPRVNKPADDE